MTVALFEQKDNAAFLTQRGTDAPLHEGGATGRSQMSGHNPRVINPCRRSLFFSARRRLLR